MAQLTNEKSRLNTLSEDYTALQNSITSTITSRQKLEAQQQENVNVQKEFKNLSDDAKVYKLIGPVLMQQERVEAEGAVGGRLEFIGGEIKRIEQQLKTLQEKREEKGKEIYNLQSQMEQQQGEGQAGDGS